MCKAEHSLSLFSERSVLQEGFVEIREDTSSATTVTTLLAPGAQRTRLLGRGWHVDQFIDVQG